MGEHSGVRGFDRDRGGFDRDQGVSGFSHRGVFGNREVWDWW
jgi:hypothetical protein